MLYFRTGKPGNGKTLFCIDEVRAMAKGRRVYYDGIELTEKGKRELGWVEFASVEKIGNVRELEDGRLRLWPNIPDGSVVIVDEVQRYWRQRKQGSDVPRAVQAIETHRHFGLDLFFITQDPTLVDVNVRKLAWEHKHIKRIFGTQSATIYTWKQKVASVGSDKEYEGCLSETWPYAKDVYELYKSAEVHTATKQLPYRQLFYIAAGVGGLAFAIWWVSWSFQKDARGGDVEGGAPEVAERAAPARGRAGRAAVGGWFWEASARSPRLEAYANSAPLFDELQRVRSQPRVAGCMRLDTVVDGRVSVDCRCTTGQGTRLEMTVRECVRLVRVGWFDPTREEVDVKAENIAYLNRRDAGGGGGVQGAERKEEGDARIGE